MIAKVRRELAGWTWRRAVSAGSHRHVHAEAARPARRQRDDARLVAEIAGEVRRVVKPCHGSMRGRARPASARCRASGSRGRRCRATARPPRRSVSARLASSVPDQRVGLEQRGIGCEDAALHRRRLGLRAAARPSGSMRRTRLRLGLFEDDAVRLLGRAARQRPGEGGMEAEAEGHRPSPGLVTVAAHRQRRASKRERHLEHEGERIDRAGRVAVGQAEACTASAVCVDQRRTRLVRAKPCLGQRVVAARQAVAVAAQRADDREQQRRVPASRTPGRRRSCTRAPAAVGQRPQLGAERVDAQRRGSDDLRDRDAIVLTRIARAARRARALAAAAVTRSAIALRSSSVKLFSPGCSVTSTASDFCPSGTPVPRKSSNSRAATMFALSAPLTARTRSPARQLGRHEEGEVARHRLQRRRRVGGARESRLRLARGNRVEENSDRRHRHVDVERLEHRRVEHAEARQHGLGAEPQRGRLAGVVTALPASPMTCRLSTGAPASQQRQRLGLGVERVERLAPCRLPSARRLSPASTATERRRCSPSRADSGGRSRTGAR